MKSIFAIACILAFTGLYLIPAFALPAQEAGREDTLHKTKLNTVDVWGIATTWRDQPAEVLQPQTTQQKEAVARIYPDGKMRNALNVMLVRGPDYLALVDTGLPANLPQLKEGITAAGFTVEDVTHVIITHAHGDHVGGLTVDGTAVFPKAKVVFSERELNFWMNPANAAQTPERARPIFTQLPAVLKPYEGRVETVAPEMEFLPGLRLVEAYGHTPGHVGVLVRPEGTPGLLFWGDLVHGMLVQLEYPDVATAYDVDPAASIHARKALLARAAKEKWLVTGVHVPAVAPWPAQ